LFNLPSNDNLFKKGTALMHK